LAEVRRVPGAAQAVTGELDVEAVLKRRDEVIHDLDDTQQLSWLEDHGITLIRGHGRLDGERRVRVDEQTYEARQAVVIAVGSHAAMPSITGLAEAKPWTNREVTTAQNIPSSLVILGGSAVGVEMAQAYSSLGAKVSLVEAEDRLLPREEPFVGEELRDALLERGVEIHLGAKAKAVHRDAQGVTVTLDGDERVGVKEILVAVGRRPLTDDLGLESVGLEPGKSIAVDDTLRVKDMPWLFAIGDVNGRSLLTHMGKYQARIVSTVIEGGDARATREASITPRVVFTEPQVAAVGFTLKDAREQGINVRAYDVSSSGSAGASFYGHDTPGTSRLVFDEDRAVIVGATFTGVDVAEWVHAATIAIVGEVAAERLWEAVPAFPTRSEIWLKLLERRQDELSRPPSLTIAS
jgi:pyruvate/2-oxoglutarate dehydrogenase complex dihydrolipoamide dehydrogenase (E3) component